LSCFNVVSASRYILHRFLRWFYPYLFIFAYSPTTVYYTLSLHDALPISATCSATRVTPLTSVPLSASSPAELRTCCTRSCFSSRSEEHTSELQSRENLVCRLLLEKKKKQKLTYSILV